MELGHARSPRERTRIGVTFYGVALLGISAGATGVLLPAQMSDYGIDKSTVSLMFLTQSAGYITCAMANGVLIHRLGIRAHLMAGTTVALAAMGLMALRPSFVVFLALQVAFGFGIGALDAGFNSFLSTLPRSTALLNYFHAFFGVGALIGPVVAAWMLDSGLAWNLFLALVAVLLAPLLAALTSYPAVEPVLENPEPRPPISGALRLAAVWLTAAFLGVYVGLEQGVGSWGFSFLTEERDQQVLAAGWTISAFWGGLTLGRFILNALAERIGMGVVGLSATCIGALAASTLLTWLVPTHAAAAVGLVTLGFFLGPLYPTIIATLPSLVPQRLVATSIGVLVAVSVVGGAAFPYLVGASAQGIGAWVLMPICLGLAVLLGLLWWRIARRLSRAAPVPADRVPDPLGAAEV